MAGDGVIGDNSVDTSRRVFLPRATVATGAIGVGFALVPFILIVDALGARAPSAHRLSLTSRSLIPGRWSSSSAQAADLCGAPDACVLATLAGHDDRLKDPTSENSDQPPYAKNVQRARNPEYLVLIGVCTHLGCMPRRAFEAAFPELGRGLAGRLFLSLPPVRA